MLHCHETTTLRNIIKDVYLTICMWFTGSLEKVVIFSPNTPNVNFVEAYMFREFQKHQA